MTSDQQHSHRVGLMLVGGAALAWSLSGLFIRQISADLMTMLFWRGVFSGAAQLALFLAIERHAALRILGRLRWSSLLVAIFSVTGMITGIASMRYTTIADVMVIYATVPFVTAGLAYVVIGERPSRSTLLASAVALTGVGIMMWGAEFDGSLTGKMLAIGTTLSMACMTVTMRRHREVPMLQALGLSAWLCSLACIAFAQPLSISARDLGLTAMFGILQNAAGLALYTFGSKRVPAAEATLLAALEVPFTPLWVFIAFGETPSLQTALGGGVVLAALFGHILLEFRGGKPSADAPFEVLP